MADFHKHHIVYRSQGGANDPSNIAILSPYDHALLHALDFIEGGPLFDYRHEAWSLLPTYIREKVRKEQSQRMALNNPSHKPEVREKHLENIRKNYDQICSDLSKGRETQRQKKVGVYAISPEQRVENGRKGGLRGGGGHKKRPVVCLETDVEYASAYHASESTGINRGHIGECCRGKRKTAGGHTWEFVSGDR